MTSRFIYLFGLFLLLTGCISHYHNGKTFSSRLSRQTPHASTYTVWGKSYHVLKNSKDYQEKGVASWYGKPFHRRYTSSGERYNMFKMTAAHKTLPLSTYVMVTNLRNNRKVVVKINDRGPFVSNRLIDLSYAAAKKLGMVNLGVTQVNIKAITPIRA